MPSLLLLFIFAQVPAVPGEGTLVSVCKQGRLSACQELAKLNPQKAAKIQAEFAKAALGQQVLKEADEEAREKEDAKTNESSEAASDEPPNCKGQEHHIISRRIAEQLEQHETLRGLYKPRDERFKTIAKDEKSHCGYQDWHRSLDKEVMEWLVKERRATPEQFMRFLREIYNRKEMLKRFPNGF